MFQRLQSGLEKVTIDGGNREGARDMADMGTSSVQVFEYSDSETLILGNNSIFCFLSRSHVAED